MKQDAHRKCSSGDPLPNAPHGEFAVLFSQGVTVDATFCDLLGAGTVHTEGLQINRATIKDSSLMSLLGGFATIKRFWIEVSFYDPSVICHDSHLRYSLTKIVF